MISGPGWKLLVGDCLEHLREMPDASIDALVTDPPAGIGFMGREWDKDRGGRDAWIAWLAERMREAMRVMKPGAHGVVWALPRTSHWTACALEDAGFEIRDVLMHLFFSGFPKSLDVSKAIARHLGAEREVVGTRTDGVGNTAASLHRMEGLARSREQVFDVTAPATDEARRWEGFGTACKPAAEHWILIRKRPEGSIAANVLRHGTGGLNVDACRVGTVEDTRRNAAGGDNGLTGTSTFKIRERRAEEQAERDGRWPPHLAFTHALDCTPEACGALCPVAELDRQSGWTASSDATRRNRPEDGVVQFTSAPTGIRESFGHADSGGASRFFPVFWPFGYHAKPDRRERDVGCEQLELLSPGEATGGRKEGSAGLQNPRAGAGRTSGGRNGHPTVKAVSLMQWLIQFVTPPNGLILDPFAGSGSTLLAASRMGMRSIGIELEQAHVEIAKARLTGDAPLLARLYDPDAPCVGCDREEAVSTPCAVHGGRP